MPLFSLSSLARAHRDKELERLLHVAGRLAAEHAAQPIRGRFELLDEYHGRGEVLAFRILRVALGQGLRLRLTRKKQQQK